MIINIRSPYFIEVNESGQVGSKIELFIWKGTGSVPSTPTYTFSKPIASTTQRKNNYNISPFVSEFITNLSYLSLSTDFYANVQVKRYKETSIGVYSLIDTLNFTALSGYNNYMNGYNQINSLNNFKVLSNDNIEQYYLNNDPYALSCVIPNINVYVNLTSPDRVDVTYQRADGLHSVTDTYNTVGKNLLSIPITKVNYHYKNGNQCIIKYYVGTTLTQTKTFNVVPICEPKYTPVICSFINRFGGSQDLYFFKAQVNSIATQGTKYNVAQADVNYNELIGKAKHININGTQTIRLNTGWVDESYSELIQDLMLSESILLDDQPALIKTQSTELKTNINNKTINYEIEFEFNYDLINNII